MLWDWRNGKGRLKDFAARSFLLKLTEREPDLKVAALQFP